MLNMGFGTQIDKKYDNIMRRKLQNQCKLQNPKMGGVLQDPRILLSQGDPCQNYFNCDRKSKKYNLENLARPIQPRFSNLVTLLYTFVLYAYLFVQTCKMFWVKFVLTCGHSLK